MSLPRGERPANFSLRVFDKGSHRLPGESTRESAIRRTKERAAELHIRLIGKPEVVRFEEGFHYGPGWFVEWKQTEGLVDE
jgi:hypothetical protein